MKSFTVTYERDVDGWWVAEVRELQPVHTQGRTVREARRRIREALAAYLDDDAAAAKARLVDDIRLPKDLSRLVKRANALRAKAAKTSKAAAEATRATVSAARSKGFSLQELADVLGVTRARIQQIAHLEA